MSQFESIFQRLFAPPDAEQGPRACVFDVDSTLFCVSSRTEKILHDYADLKSFPDLKQVHFTPKDWGLRSALVRHQVKMTLDQFEDLKKFWVDRFFSNDYLKFDRLYEGSNDFVNHCQKVGYKVLYLTGRDELSMRTGTLEQLRVWGFPLEDEADLIMRPRSFQKDEDFKVYELEKIQAKYRPVYFFENEPVIINRVLGAQLGVHVVFMDSIHSGRETVPETLARIQPETYSLFLKNL